MSNQEQKPSFFPNQQTHNTIESLIDPLGNTTAYSYDDQGNVNTETYPNTQVKTISYAPIDSLPTTVKNTDNSMLFFDHTKQGQIKLIAGSDVTLEFTYNRYQQLQNLTSKEHNTALSYDLLGAVEVQTQDDIEVAYSQDVVSHSHTVSFLENQAITTTQKTKERTTTIAHNTQDPITLSYDIKAKTQTTTYPNGTQEHYTFNANKELIKLDTAEQSYHYQRDALGRITSINSVQGTQLQNNESNTEYSYDVLGQLIQAGSETFEYDKAGNNQHKQSTYDTSMNQLLEDSTYRYTYDANGNLNRKINKQSNHMLFYRYNDFNQLVEHYEATAEDKYVYRLLYTYDGFSRRITKTYIDSTDETKSYAHHYLYDNQNIIAILDNNNNKELLATIVHHPSQVDTPLSITNHETNETYYYHRDHQGSIVALTNEEGNTVESIEYDGHYGTITNHTQTEETLNPYGYTGRETDLKDLYYYRARYYDPTTQRFLSRDPIEFEAGDFNFYRYVGNDCVNFRDPSGLVLVQLGGALLGGVVGGAFEYFGQTGPTNWSMVFAAAGAGAIAGLATTTGGAMALGALTGMGNNAYKQLNSNDPCKEFQFSDMIASGIGGLAGGKMGGTIGDLGKGTLKNAIHRDARRIIPGALPNAANHGNSGAIIGAVAGESLGSKVTNTSDDIIDSTVDGIIDLGEIIVTPNDCPTKCSP